MGNLSILVPVDFDAGLRLGIRLKLGLGLLESGRKGCMYWLSGRLG